MGTRSATSLTFGPHGGSQALYYTTYTDGGEIRRVAHATGNRVPTAVIEGEQLWDETRTVDFDASGSSDPDGDVPLAYLWDFGDGTTAETATPTTSHTYAASGMRTATLRVRDSRGAVSDPHTVEVFPTNRPPAPTVTAPGPGFRFKVGAEIPLSGAATDPEDGPIPDGKLVWQVLRHHNGNHTHPYASGPGGELPIVGPKPEDLFSTGAGNYLEVRLTAPDSQGLRSTVSRILRPRRINMTFETDPIDLKLRINGVKIQAPRTLVSWRRYRLNVEAPSPQRDEAGRRWVFRSWSDGRDREHRIRTPASDATYTAKYRRPRG